MLPRGCTALSANSVQIYQIVRKLADEQSQLEKGGQRLTISTVYDSIKQSNSSLKRRPKKLLEDSIERVLLVLKEEQDDSESIDGDFDGLEEENGVKLKVCLFLFVMKRHLMIPGAQYYE